MNADNEKLIGDLLAKAQGSRSLRQFAEEVGINVSSLSRMRAGLFKPKREVIERIVEKAADPDAVSVQEFVAAFDRIAEENKSKQQIYEEMRNDELAQRATILMGLLISGYSIQEMRENPKDNRGHRYADIEIVTNALSSDDKCSWAFRFMGSPRIASQVGNKVTLRWLQSYLTGVAAAFYFGEIRLSRYSIVMTDRGLFHTTKKEWSSCRIPNEISFILVDTLSKDIFEEFMIPTIDERDPVYPFKKSKIERRNPIG